MIKNNKWKMIVSSVLILLPMLVAIFGGKYFPEAIAVHWGLNGEADGFANVSVVFIVMPLILLAFHWGCMYFTDVVTKNTEQSKKIMEITYWIIPAVSLLSCGVIVAAALGYTANILAFVWLILAAAFLIIGNYMPKTTRNVAMGIKIRWTLANDENWSATHRFAGKVYMLIGILCFPAIFLAPSAFPYACLGLILCCVLAPLLYSYLFYKKQIKEGTATEEDYKNGYGDLVKDQKLGRIIAVVGVVVAVAVVAVILFTGEIKPTAAEDALTVKASFWTDLSLDYADIDSVEYRAEGVKGTRTAGAATARLLVGLFHNDEFGTYTRYTYTGDHPCIVLKVDGKAVVIGTQSETQTRALYQTILEKTGK